MPAKTPEARPALERVYTATLPVISAEIPAGREKTLAKLGRLLQIDTNGASGLTDQQRRNIAAMNRTVEEGWLTGNIQACHARIIRCCGLQATGDKYRASSDQLRTWKTLNQAESDKGVPITYERAIPEWRALAEGIGDEQTIRIVDESIARIADTLVSAQEATTTAGLLRKIALRYGRHVFTEKTSITFGALGRRSETGQTGPCLTNLNAVVAMLRHAKRPQKYQTEKKNPAEIELADLWDEPWLERFRTVWLADTKKRLAADRQDTSEPAMLAERLKMLASFGGSHQNDNALRKQYRIPGEHSRALAGNDLRSVPPASIVMILDALVADKKIPAAAKDDFLASLKGMADVVAVAQETPATRLRAAFDGRGIDNSMIAAALNVRARRPNEVSPVTFVKETIDEGRKNDLSQHALACLAYGSFAEAEAAAGAFWADYKSRQRNVGKRFTTAHAFMTQFGLTNADLPEPFKAAEIPVEEASNAVGDPRLTSAILNTGWTMSAEAVEHWVAYHEPDTLTQVLTALVAKVGSHKLVEHVELNVKDSLKRFAQGTDLPALCQLRTMLKDGKAVMGHALETDWYRRRGELHASMPMAGRVVETLVMREHVSRSAFTEARVPADGSRGSAGNARKTMTLLANDEALSDDRFEAMLRAVGLDGQQPEGLFLRAVRASPAMGTALNVWCASLVAAGNTDLLLNILEARAQLLAPEPPAPQPSARLRAAIARKEAVVARLRDPDACDDPAPPLLAVFRAAPGLRDSELRAWVPCITMPEASHIAAEEPIAAASQTPAPAVTEAAADQEVADPDAVYAQVIRLIEASVDEDWRPFVAAAAQAAKARLAFDARWRKGMREPAKFAKEMGAAVRIKMVKDSRP